MTTGCSARDFKNPRLLRRPHIGAALALLVMVPAVAGLMASPAAAQFSKAYKFLDAVRTNDGQAVQDALSDPATTIINTKDVTSGDTALMIVTRRRDYTWMSFLLGRGADANLHNNHDETALTIASGLGYIEGVTLLLQIGAKPDEASPTGQTPLIDAVLRRDLPMIRVLLAGGANPDRADSAGRSARDYAARYGKDSAIASALAAAKTKADPATTYGPTF